MLDKLITAWYYNYRKREREVKRNDKERNSNNIKRTG